jgi:hypothetical protein
MSFMTAAPVAIEGASGVLAGIGGSVEGVTAGVAPLTSAVIPPSATDPTAILMAEMLNLHAGIANASLAVWMMEHSLYTTTLSTSGASYALAEAANLATLG